MEADAGMDFVAEKPESHSPEKHEKKKKKRKKREIQLANGAEAVTGDDLTATQVVEEAPSSSKSGGKKSQKRKKEYDIPDVGENGDAEMSGTTNRDGSDDKKKKREAEITKDTKAVTPEEPIEDEKKMGDALTANTKNGVEKAPYATKSSDKKSKKWDRENVVVVGGENGAANVSDSGKGHVSNVKDVSATMSDNKKRNKQKRENNLLSGGENDNAEMQEIGKDGDYDDSTTSKQMSKKNRKKVKDAVSGGPGDLGGIGAADMAGDGKEGDSIDLATSKQRPRRLSSSKPTKRVSFAGEVEVFDDKGKSSSLEENDNALVHGKRFTLEEDDLVREAVMKFIKGNQLGKEGLQMVLNSQKYSHMRGCWKAIGASLPWRPYKAVYFRAHILFERCEARKWVPHEYEALRRLHEQYGPQWKKIAVELGKHQGQVRNTWRWMGVANRNHGNWSQEEYQRLFDLVNLDLAMKAFVEKKTKHGMLRDNISWEAISTKLSTRAQPACCLKWYKQLTSPLVSQGLWMDTDDYRLLDALQKVDACCVEDVDWDNLIEYRSGDICRKRWAQMTRHIGGHREKSFIEQLDVLSKRYNPEMLEYRKDEGSSNATTLSSGTSPSEETGHDKHVEVL